VAKLDPSMPIYDMKTLTTQRGRDAEQKTADCITINSVRLTGDGDGGIRLYGVMAFMAARLT
jgi:hypothetical protein